MLFIFISFQELDNNNLWRNVILSYHKYTFFPNYHLKLTIRETSKEKQACDHKTFRGMPLELKSYLIVLQVYF